MKRPSSPRTITFRIRRYDPERAVAPHWQTRQLPVPEGLTVLEALHLVKGEHDASLAWRASCRMGICGSCGMYINGLPRLACQTQVLHLNSEIVEIASLPNYPIVKDLVPDLQPLFDRHAAVKPYVVAQPAANGREPTTGEIGGELLQSPAQREAYAQFSYCTKCGLCLAACPTAATDPHFLGPQALAQALRYSADSRDAGLVGRLQALDAMHGPFQCHLAGACTDACPKGVDPALGIQLLKRELSLAALGWRRPNPPSALAPLAAEFTPIEKIPSPPPRTVNPERPIA
jgi:succinate dehydrogenase / fumarate reductase iron-sulfur subunit